MSNNQDNSTVSVSQVAKRFGVHPTTVLRWIQKGYFGPVGKRGPEPNSSYAIPAHVVTAFWNKLNPSASNDQEPPGPPLTNTDTPEPSDQQPVAAEQDVT